MAATAYASLVSLLNTIHQIHTNPLISTFFDINQNKSLSEKVDFLVHFVEEYSDTYSRVVDFVEEYSDADNREVEDLGLDRLVRRIGDAAHEAEDTIEVYVADRVRGRRPSLSILPKMEMIIEQMESIKEEVIKVKAEIAKRPSSLSDMLPSSSAAAAPPPPAADDATTMLGFDDYAHKLWDELTGLDVKRKIISITGMGGIGKTTLARNLYEDSRVVRHFNVRAWVTVSQDASARRVFMQALSCLTGCSTDRDRVDDQQLSDELYKALFNRRYFIVLDDTWSVEIWDKIKFFFPENSNRSRIIVTTRESKLVDYIGSSALAIKFLGKENSWKLFCEKAFPHQDFPPELEGAGNMIVKKCGGLPLAITVIGGLLGKSPRTQEYWEKIAKDRSLILNSAENKPLSILYLSYKYLPVCLKPCFLYLGLCREDFRINMKTLIRLWVAEGFIKSSRGQNLEEVAESYFMDLADRNLIFFPNLDCFSIHDLVRDLCLKVGEKEKFSYVQRDIDGDRHFITDETTVRLYPQESHAYKTPSIFNPLIVPAGERAAPFKTRLLRVWCRDNGSPYYDAHQEVNMRFLCNYSYNGDGDDYLVPSLLLRFWCLQTLFVPMVETSFEMTEIWKMPQLRHINIWKVCLPDPPPLLSDDNVCVLHNLQTLKTVYNLIFTEELCKRIPNIKELHILSECYHLENLCSFNKLESLKYTGPMPEYCAGDLLHNIKFPTGLKELTLYGCMMEWSYMAVIASLPHLQRLSIQGEPVATTEWIFVDEKFVSLKYLTFIDCKRVTKWIAHSSNFPVLEKLYISHFPRLDEIPSSIGEIPTLREIRLSCCNESANISVVEILHEQQRFENLGLQVILGHFDSEAAAITEKIQELGLTCQNLVIESYHFGRKSSRSTVNAAET